MVKMDVRVITLLYWMTQLFHCSTDIADVCPLTSFCSDRQQGGNISHQSNSCCFPCSCHRNCKLVGTCCHDAEKDDRLQYVYPCANQAEIYGKYLSLRFASTPVLYSRVITDCHNGVDEYDVSNETISRCRNARHLEDLVFVTGKTSGITYINRHCALCNGDDDFDVWDLSMVSRNTDAIFSINASIEARDEYLLRTGAVMSTPPTDFAALSTFCSRSSFVSCNISGKWNVYDKDIIDKCKFYNSVYYETERKRVYKNPFCYICNNSPKDTTIDKDCGNLVDSLFSAKSSAVQFIYTQLFMMTRETNDDQGPTHQVCNFGETLDLFTGTCTKLLCPPGTAVVEDCCEPMFPEDSGITLVVSFYVVFEDLIAEKEVERRDVIFLEELRKHMVSKVKEYDRRCDYCQSQFSIIDDELVFSISFKSSPRCSYLQYLNIIAKLHKESPIKLYSNSIERDIRLIAGNSTDDFTELGFLFENNRKAGLCGIRFQFTENIIPCSSILISLSDMYALSLKQQIREDILRIGTDVGNGTLRVCLEEYNKIHARSSCTGDSYMLSTLVTFNIFYFTIVRGYCG